jgi:hypothetical protein
VVPADRARQARAVLCRLVKRDVGGASTVRH